MKIVIELPDDIQIDRLASIYNAARAIGLKPILCSRDGKELYRNPAAVIRRVALTNRDRELINVF